MKQADVCARVAQGADQLGISLNQAQLAQISHYLELLLKWNKAYNLTAIKQLDQMLGLHIFDSLAIAPQIEATRLIDVGTGAGLPGIILAIENPQRQITLLDSNGKKTRFLTQVKTELGLSQIEIVQSRVEKYRPQQRFDAVLSRAFATLKDMTDNARHLVSDDGYFWAMKGRYPTQEINELDTDISLSSSVALNIPEVSAERHLLQLRLY